MFFYDFSVVYTTRTRAHTPSLANILPNRAKDSQTTDAKIPMCAASR